MLLSLNDIEHRILRGRFREPRIHFALNCASNGCPPMRPQAYAPEAIRETLHAATRQSWPVSGTAVLIASTTRSCVSPLPHVCRRLCRRSPYHRRIPAGVLRFIAEHTGEPFEAIADYTVVYNIYDWGLNDVHRDPQLRPITFHESVETFHAQDGVLRELYLYDGNFCNRACAWCTVFGSPRGGTRRIPGGCSRCPRRRGPGRQHQVLRG